MSLEHAGPAVEPVEGQQTGQIFGGSERPGLRVANAIYGVCLALSIAAWFVAIRSPLWLDETGSYWQISAGFSQIWPRQYMCLAFPAYSYILWFASKMLGISEIALRVPSILAMLAAVYVFYLCARELFDREMALIAVIIFSVNPITVFESNDARPYAFVMLTTNLTLLMLLRLRKSDSVWLAGLFGFLSALIIYFHFLAAVILPAFLLCFIVWRYRSGKIFRKQMAVGLAVFVLTFLPLIPGLEHLFETGKTHVFQTAPGYALLVMSLTSLWYPFAFGAAVICAALMIRTNERCNFQRWQILLCASAALIPILILFGVSEWTPIHLFDPRHQTPAVPGVALAWALLLSFFRWRVVRLTFCVVLVGLSAGFTFTMPSARQHGYSWKGALAAVEKNASPAEVPVLVCSDWPESNYVKMSPGLVKNSVFYAPLSYYRVSVPVVPLPRALNTEAKRAGRSFIQKAELKHERFLAAAWFPSYATLRWLKQRASGEYDVKVLGVYDGVKVLNFVPRTP